MECGIFVFSSQTQLLYMNVEHCLVENLTSSSFCANKGKKSYSGDYDKLLLQFSPVIISILKMKECCSEIFRRIELSNGTSLMIDDFGSYFVICICHSPCYAVAKSFMQVTNGFLRLFYGECGANIGRYTTNNERWSQWKRLNSCLLAWSKLMPPFQVFEKLDVSHTVRKYCLKILQQVRGKVSSLTHCILLVKSKVLALYTYTDSKALSSQDCVLLTVLAQIDSSSATSISHLMLGEPRIPVDVCFMRIYSDIVLVMILRTPYTLQEVFNCLSRCMHSKEKQCIELALQQMEVNLAKHQLSNNKSWIQVNAAWKLFCKNCNERMADAWKASLQNMYYLWLMYASDAEVAVSNKQLHQTLDSMRNNLLNFQHDLRSKAMSSLPIEVYDHLKGIMHWSFVDRTCFHVIGTFPLPSQIVQFTEFIDSCTTSACSSQCVFTINARTDCIFVFLLWWEDLSRNNLIPPIAPIPNYHPQRFYADIGKIYFPTSMVKCYELYAVFKPHLGMKDILIQCRLLLEMRNPPSAVPYVLNL